MLLFDRLEIINYTNKQQSTGSYICKFVIEEPTEKPLNIQNQLILHAGFSCAFKLNMY